MKPDPFEATAEAARKMDDFTLLRCIRIHQDNARLYTFASSRVIRAERHDNNRRLEKLMAEQRRRRAA